MKRVKRLLFFLAISLLVIGVAVPGSAGPKNKYFGKVRHVSGDWTTEDKARAIGSALSKGSLKNNFTFSAPMHPSRWRCENMEYA